MKIRKCASIICIVLLMIAIVVYMGVYRLSTSVYDNTSSEYPSVEFGAITVANGLLQNIEIAENMQIDSIDIQLATYARVNDSNYIISASHNEVNIYRERVHAADLRDNSFFSLNDLDVMAASGDIISISIIADGEVADEQAITAWIKQCPTTGALYRVTPDGNVPVEGELSLKIIHEATITTYMATKYLHGNTVIPQILGGALLMLIGALLYLLVTQKEEKEP